MADVANANPNSRSRQSTADIIVTGRRRVDHYKFPELKLGDVCMVNWLRDAVAKEADR